MNMLFPTALLAPLLLLSGCGQGSQKPEAKVRGAWVRLPAAPSGTGAGYFEAEANTKGEALVSAAAPGARVEMHESMTMNHMASMQPIASAAFQDGKLKFAPGGKHLMIFGLDPKLKPGATVPLSLRFRAAPTVTVEARLVGAGDPAPGDDG
ncbi:MAG: hypothetical protein JWO25_685 [Alphaproteobacteria bacterium]|nr:hypothetical protein [Alphaproteobacteria bacterium]